MKFSAIIPAGGTSSRFKGKTNKLLEKIYDKEVIHYTVDAFVQAEVEEIIICANPAIIPTLSELFKNYHTVKVISGGKTRQESVYKGLQEASGEYVLIHDGARPMITKELIQKVEKEVILKKSVTVMTKTIDTIKEVDETGKVIKTIDRTKLYNTQTPQAFETKLIKEVHERLKFKNFTDDAGMVEFLGKDVYIVEGDYTNIKVTTQSDIALAKIYLKQP